MQIYKYNEIFKLFPIKKHNYPYLTSLFDNIIYHIKENYQNNNLTKELKIASCYVVLQIYIKQDYKKIEYKTAFNIIKNFIEYYYSNFESYKNSLEIISDYFIMELTFYNMFVKKYLLENNNTNEIKLLNE